MWRFKMTYRFSNQISGCLLAAVIVLGLLPAVSFAGVPGVRSFAQNAANPNPRVLPPVSAAYGHTYAEWSELWWLWFIPQTSTNNAINDCSAGQSGQVWFLEAFGSTCAVPAGKALFFPIVDAECSNLEDPPFYGLTAADRSACAKLIIDHTANLAVEIDGVSIQNLMAYRFQSPDFSFTAPPDNLDGIPPGSGQSTADGYYLMVAPLSAGQHTIHSKALS
jgi:hypothetical protein